MLRSLFSGISGLQAFQEMLDVTGDNIANVDTVGYKSSGVIFEDTLSQLIKGASAPQGGTGGSNPAQIGLGVSVAGIDQNFSQGASQSTGRSTDLMIQGDGFFQVAENGQQYYTRAGSFSFDANGTLVTPDGAEVQGWSAGANGVVNTNGPTGNITLPVNTELAPVVTANATLGGNLNSADPVGTSVAQSVTMYDTQGNAEQVTLTFTKTDTNTWSMDVADANNDYGTQTVTFDGSGNLTSATPMTFTPSWSNGASVNLNMTGVTQYAGDDTVEVSNQDGSASGTLQSFLLSSDGTIVGVFSNGLKQNVGQIALATVNNPEGLESVGNSLYQTTSNSGLAQVGIAGSGGRGTLASGMLEMSNVDLAQEFTNLIVAQTTLEISHLCL